LETDVRQSDVPNVEEDYYIAPPHISPRIPAQAACFTVSKNPAEPFNRYVERSIIVRARLKQDLLDRIGRYGLTEGALFPDLDGLGRELEEEADSEKLAYTNPCRPA
jgi:hypothetical protein